jgi:hypothetical protein
VLRVVLIKVTSTHEVSLDQCLRVNGVKKVEDARAKGGKVGRLRTRRRGFGVLLEQGPVAVLIHTC